jgi:hypothetical protein
MVECDIRVPDKWPSYFQHPTMTPYEYFEEMSPLFCTTDLISEHMQDHIQRFELSEKPRRLLVGGMPGRQMLIATPLLKRYLEHCMVVTKIYQVVEFFVCHVFSYVMYFRMSCVFVCHVFSYVMYFRMSCVFVCHVFSYVMCFRIIHFILISTAHALFLTCLPVSIYGT